MKKRTLKLLFLITVLSSLFVGCGSKKTAATQTEETKNIKNTSTQSTQATQSTEITTSETADNTEHTEAAKQIEQTEQATEELIADNNYSVEPAPVQQPENEINQSGNDNAQNDTTSEDSAPVQQPEQPLPAEPEQPAPPNDPNVIIIPDGGDTCPYETLKWTYYQGHFGFFKANNDPDVETMNMEVALYPKGGDSQYIIVASYRNTGVVKFLYNDEMNENTVVMP